jgi:hypothetical protein
MTNLNNRVVGDINNHINLALVDTTTLIHDKVLSSVQTNNKVVGDKVVINNGEYVLAIKRTTQRLMPAIRLQLHKKLFAMNPYHRDWQIRSHVNGLWS